MTLCHPLYRIGGDGNNWAWSRPHLRWHAPPPHAIISPPLWLNPSGALHSTHLLFSTAQFFPTR